MSNTLKGVILLPRLQVENANAISGPLTWGFPSPTAFAGFVHALHRKFGSQQIRLDGVGIICHRFDPQIYKPSGKYQHYFRLARYPVDEHGDTAGIVEEGRAHMEVSLLIGLTGDCSQREGEIMADTLHHAALGMRLAGGSIRPSPSGKRYKAAYLSMGDYEEDIEKAFRSFRRRLIPGFALIDRADLLAEHLAHLQETMPETTLLDALLDLNRLNIKPGDAIDQSDGKVAWNVSRARPGWLVPLPVGYGSISKLYDPGEVRNARDNDTPFRFVESLCSLGEWRSPHRINHPRQLLWYHRADPDTGLYIVEQTHTSA